MQQFVKVSISLLKATVLENWQPDDFEFDDYLYSEYSNKFNVKSTIIGERHSILSIHTYILILTGEGESIELYKEYLKNLGFKVKNLQAKK